jgi:sulfoxide reductase heme-binding subunit YedZ
MISAVTTSNTDPTQHLWWLASRASGIVAILLLTFTVIVGLMMGGKFVQRLTGKQGKGALAIKNLLQTHEQASIAALIAVAAHGLTLLGDAFMHMSLSNIAIPFTDAYRPFYVGVGIIGGYIAAALGLSFYLRGRIGAARWKKMHRWTIAAYALAVIHALGAGTDASTAWFQIPLLASAGVVTMMFLIRASSGARHNPGPNPRTAHRRHAVVTAGERP